MGHSIPRVVVAISSTPPSPYIKFHPSCKFNFVQRNIVLMYVFGRNCILVNLPIWRLNANFSDSRNCGKHVSTSLRSDLMMHNGEVLVICLFFHKCQVPCLSLLSLTYTHTHTYACAHARTHTRARTHYIIFKAFPLPLSLPHSCW